MYYLLCLQLLFSSRLVPVSGTVTQSEEIQCPTERHPYEAAYLYKDDNGTNQRN